MDEDKFEHLLSEVDLLQPSSQGPLINAAANLHDDDDENDMGDSIDASPGAALWQHPSVHANLPARQPPTDRYYPNAHVIDKIEAVMEQMVDALLHDKNEISITLKTRRRPRNSSSQKIDNIENGTVSTRTLRFPGKTEDEAWRFSVVLRILELIHEALRSDVIISKRDMYYRDPALFGTQTHVDRYVDDIAFTFGISRLSLNVAAAAKGLVAGAFQICRRDGSVIDLATDKEGTLVPTLRDVLSISMTKVKWILVIEKEATFRSIASSDFWSAIVNEGIIVTGKGYPDLSTRALLRVLSRPSLQNGFASPPVYGLVDFDPDGIGILSVYRNGSKALAHETLDHAVPEMKWLGLRSEHLDLAIANTRIAQGLLTLTSRDRQKAVKMLAETSDLASEDPEGIRTELQIMLLLNVKAELQLLDSVPKGMIALLGSIL